MDKESIEKLGDVSAMIDSILEKQLANIPESQREMMRGIMEKTVKSQMPKEAPKPSYSFNGKSTSFNGIDCEVVIKKAGKNKSEFCVTKYSNVGMSSDEYSVITSFQNTIAVLAQKYGADNSMDFSSLGNFMPVKFMQEGNSGTLNSVNHDSLDPSIFAVPEGYSEMVMPF